MDKIYSISAKVYFKKSGFFSLSHWEVYYRKEIEQIQKSSIISPKDTEN